MPDFKKTAELIARKVALRRDIHRATTVDEITRLHDEAESVDAELHRGDVQDIALVQVAVLLDEALRGQPLGDACEALAKALKEAKL